MQKNTVTYLNNNNGDDNDNSHVQPPPTGTILALAREMYGPLFSNRVLELNASDERGITIVREKIKNFAQIAVANTPGRPGFKLIILDEADAMTGDAQSALRRTMERYTKVTRFCLICNYVSRIIEPLASRCAKFRFRPLPRGPMLARLETVCAGEGVQCDDEAKEALLDASGGDLRRAITLLQSASNYNAKKVDRASVYEVAGVLPDDALTPVWEAITQGLFDPVFLSIKNVLALGYSTTMMMSQLRKIIMNEATLNDVKKARMLLKLAEADKLLVDGADEELQLLDVASSLAGISAGA